jgi:hypothetical protein
MDPPDAPPMITTTGLGARALAARALDGKKTAAIGKYGGINPKAKLISKVRYWKSRHTPSVKDPGSIPPPCLRSHISGGSRCQCMC